MDIWLSADVKGVDKNLAKRLENLGHNINGSMHGIRVHVVCACCVDHEQQLPETRNCPVPILIVRHNHADDMYRNAYRIRGIIDDTCSDEELQQALKETQLL